MIVKLLTEHHLEFLSLKGGCTGSSESKMSNAKLLEISCHGSFCDYTAIFYIFNSPTASSPFCIPIAGQC